MATLSLGGASKTISDAAVTRIRAQLPKWGYAPTAAGALDWLTDMARSVTIANEQAAAAAPAQPAADPDFPAPTVLVKAGEPPPQKATRKSTRRKKG